MTSRGGRMPFRWDRAYPARWQAELRALRASGWRYRVVRSGHGVSLRLDYPVGAGGVADLRVEFPQTYPYFPAAVFDRENGLGLTRHRDMVTGRLCISEDADHRPDQLLAHVLAAQVPKLQAATRGGVTVEEVPAAEPTVAYARRNGPDIIVPVEGPPSGVDQGALVARFTVIGSQLSTGLVTRVLGPGVDISTDVSPDWYRRPFLLTVYGRWLRDPDYHPAETAEQLWERTSPALHPLQVPAPAAAPESLPPEELEILGLLVPGETAPHRMGEQWAFLIRYNIADADEPPNYQVVLRGGQALSRALADQRTPTATALAGKRVVVIGAGSLGGHLIRGLSQAGVGQVDVVDRDTIDANTHRRQYAPPARAGEPKAFIVAARAAANAPYCDLRAFHMNVRDLLDGARESSDPFDRVREDLLRDVLAADLVIDATGNVAVTRYLAALRRRHGRRFLHLSATAGTWGGVIVALDADEVAACWACVEHHRHDGTVPVPPADPDGWVLPHQCTEQTFTGTVADIATIADHALRLTTAWLVDDRNLLGGNLHVAALRDPNGTPAPVEWTVTDVGRHAACRAHS